ncbi:MAG: TonB-dependent receptor [Chitinophagaceae bacterium]|nr:TonB-dependent receptor [Chitinophagaceae bacterium]
MDCKKLLLGVLMLAPAFGMAQDSTRTSKLDEVEITETRSDFGHMYQVDGMRITAGKKSEVVNVEQLTVNKSTNNTRQIYAKVAGLNIFENDGSGLQLSIGGRGLDPNRTSNFNVRQNGYDISADALGYPESYYTPPAEALAKIEILKGAAGLQYGTQFGGLLNFQLKQPGGDKAFGIESRQTIGSWNYFGSFNAISGTNGKFQYYAFAQYKKGDGWRPNSRFESFNGYADLHYHINDKHMIGIEYTHMQYLAQQAGGLNDQMFENDPRQSNRERNWFAVNWNVLDLEWNYQISARTRWQTRVYSLLASRDAVGFRDNRVSVVDPGDRRDLLKGTFRNYALESRFLHRYGNGQKQNALLAGVRAYKGYSTNKQGYVYTGSGANFDFTEGNEVKDQIVSDYTFPNLNLAAFAEHIFRISEKWSVTPGVRLEHIRTQSDGYYVDRIYDQRDSIVSEMVNDEYRNLPRTFVIGGLGISYKMQHDLELYGNFSQNYRSVTFNDIRVVNPSFEIDPNISDEKGWSSDAGIRGNILNVIRYDVSAFYLYYGNRIGEYYTKNDMNRVIRRRSNVGVAQIYGLETYAELDVFGFCRALDMMHYDPNKLGLTAYSNLALTQATYTKSPQKNIEGSRVEYVPVINWKAGVQGKYKNFKLSYQFSYLSDQYTDATNVEDGGYSAVNGLVPAYYLMDVSAGYNWKWLTLEATLNNLMNVPYFTRRATGYPGPGIIPGDGRAFYITAGVKL